MTFRNMLKMEMTGNERQVVGLTSAAHSLNHLLEITYPALLVFIANEFGISYLFLGVIANAMALGYGLTAPVGGVFADKVGSKRMLWIQLGLTGVAALLVAASTGPWFLAVTLTLLGLAAGMYHPVGLSFITRTVRARTMAVGYHGMAGSLAVAVAPALAVVLAGLWNWRAAFLVYGAISLVGAVGVMLSKLREQLPGKDADDSQEQSVEPSSQSRQVIKILWAPLIIIFFINAMGGFIYRGVVTFLPLHLTEHLGLDLFGTAPETLAGYFATVALLFGVAGQYVGGFLGERIRREALTVGMALCIVPPLVLVGMTGGLWLVVTASVFAFFNFMTQPIYVSLMADYTPSRHQGGIFGLMFLMANGIGSFAATMGGYITERGDTAQIFLVLGGIEALIVVAAIFLLISAARRTRAIRRSQAM